MAVSEGPLSTTLLAQANCQAGPNIRPPATLDERVAQPPCHARASGRGTSSRLDPPHTSAHVKQRPPDETLHASTERRRGEPCHPQDANDPRRSPLGRSFALARVRKSRWLTVERSSSLWRRNCLSAVEDKLESESGRSRVRSPCVRQSAESLSARPGPPFDLRRVSARAIACARYARNSRPTDDAAPAISHSDPATRIGRVLARIALAASTGAAGRTGADAVVHDWKESRSPRQEHG
jgi:hypothetical protein